jgi:hypothetical protein
MAKRNSSKGALGAGAAAVLGLGIAGCPATPPPQEPVADPVPVTDPATDPVDDTATDPADDPVDDSTGEPVDDSTGEPTGGSAAAIPLTDPCAGDAAFTEECGYGTMTRYAVLDPKRIVNA